MGSRTNLLFNLSKYSACHSSSSWMDVDPVMQQLIGTLCRKANKHDLFGTAVFDRWFHFDLYKFLSNFLPGLSKKRLAIARLVFGKIPEAR